MSNDPAPETALATVTDINTHERVTEIAERAQMGATRGVAIETLSEAVDFAKMMCQAHQAIPEPFRGKPGMCLAVTMQALRWGFDPFGVAQNAYVVNDKVAFEAKLMVAAINANAGLVEPLDYEFEGQGQDLFCRVIGKLYRADGEVITRLYETPPIGNIKPQNSPLWKSDPQQQLSYYGARAWARRHTPQVLLGVYGQDEVRDTGSVINARRPSMAERFGGKPAIENADEIAQGPAPSDDQVDPKDIHSDQDSDGGAAEAAPADGEAVEKPEGAEAPAPVDPASSTDTREGDES